MDRGGSRYSVTLLLPVSYNTVEGANPGSSAINRPPVGPGTVEVRPGRSSPCIASILTTSTLELRLFGLEFWSGHKRYKLVAYDSEAAATYCTFLHYDTKTSFLDAS